MFSWKQVKYCLSNIKQQSIIDEKLCKHENIGKIPNQITPKHILYMFWNISVMAVLHVAFVDNPAIVCTRHKPVFCRPYCFQEKEIDMRNLLLWLVVLSTITVYIFVFNTCLEVMNGLSMTYLLFLSPGHCIKYLQISYCVCVLGYITLTQFFFSYKH